MPADDREEALAWYLAELEGLREDAGAFAHRHPQVAAGLAFGREPSEDPHVERLIEAFAFLTGRLRSVVSKQLPRLGAGMLDTLYPHLTAPTPSMGIVRFRVDPDQSRRAHGFVVKRGEEVTATTNVGATCRFRTGWDVTLWPLRIAAADAPQPELYPFLARENGARRLLRIRLEAIGKTSETIADAPPPALRFRIGGSRKVAAAIYQALFRQAGGAQPRKVWAVAPQQKGETLPGLGDIVEGPYFRLPADALRPVGFAETEALLPQPDSAHHGHRLLREYFTFPEKFLFFDICGLSAAAGAAGRLLDLVILLEDEPPPLDHPAPFELGAAPVINLFKRISEPIRVDRKRVEYPVTPDHRREQSTEIYSIEKVTAAAMGEIDGETMTPFFSFDHADAGAPDRTWWTARRQPGVGLGRAGSDMFISFRDSGYDTGKPKAEVAFAHLVCTNRGLAETIPSSTPMEWDPAGDGKRLGLEFDAPVDGVFWSVRPTPQIPAPPVNAGLWRLVSHISVNQLSFVEGADAAAALREHLRLYCPDEARAARRQIEGVAGLSGARVTERFGKDGWRGFCRGVEATLRLDQDCFADEGSAFLFGAVLARFFGLYAAVNSFCTLRVIRSEREGEWAKWPPTAGEQILI